jgi:galactonate dehydratase
MTSRPLVTKVSLHRIEVSSRTVWTILALEASDGLLGLGEATLADHDRELRAVADRLAPQLVARQPQGSPGVAWHVALPALAEAAIVSALDTALLDLEARRREVPLAALLTDTPLRLIPAYANINRGTTDRSPEGFARRARLAVARGFEVLKIAPFDEVGDTLPGAPDFASRLGAGLARMAAVRQAIGQEPRLRVDCHWRFDPAGAALMIEAAAEHRPDWIECPIPERAEAIAAIARLRRRANALGIRLAGLEHGVGVEAFAPYAEAGAYDVAMPDVKYAGGVAPMLAIGATLDRHGVAVSPHNPSGPIAHAMSLHLSAAIRGLERLELQLDESPLFAELIGEAPPDFQAPVCALPVRPGLGVAIDPERLAATAVASWPIGAS